MWQVYKGELPEKTYFGITSLDIEDRCRNMKGKPVFWLRGHPDLQRLKLEELLGRRTSEDKALALEAAFTATHWADNPKKVRGGPYCLGRLDGKLTCELKKLAQELNASSRSCHRERIQIVIAVAQGLPRTGPLNRHLRGECFRCGVKFQHCLCRSSPHSGDRAPGGSTAKRRASGRSQSGSTKRKKKFKKARSANPDFRKLKWGPNVAAGIAANNDRRARASGVRGRAVARR